jgi:anti-sigma regulatory factor (Ser/Thr protein kinase)
VDERAPARARHALDESDRVPSDVVERFRMAVSELVTNAIRHAGLSQSDDLVLTLRLSKDRVRAELSYPGPPFETELKRPPPSKESGRGLLLVEKVVNRWGLGRADGVQTWFEIDLAA